MTKKTHRKAIIFLFFIGLTFIACKKKNQEPKILKLPAITTSGANTFGCKINGEVFVPNGDFNHASIEYPSYFVYDGKFGITVRNRHDFSDKILIELYVKSGIFGVGDYKSYPVGEYEYQRVEFRNDTIINGNDTFVKKKYHLDTIQPYNIEITRLDLSEKIVSGLFEFTVVHKETNDILKITEGRFDLNNLVVQP